MKSVYCGGAVDYTTHNRVTGWQHQIEVFARDVARVYCPPCAAKIGEQDRDVMVRNIETMQDADICVFLLDGTFTVGTPVEINLRMGLHPHDVIIIHPAEPGLFVRAWKHDGAIVVPSMKEAREWLWLLAGGGG